MRHLAVFIDDLAEQIISGAKNIDLRLSFKKIVPFGQVSAGDEVLIKKSGQKVIGKFTVKKAVFFDHPEKEDLEEIKNKMKDSGGMPEILWKNKQKINYASLIYIGQVQKFLIPQNIKKSDQRGWILLNLRGNEARI
jgi:predicted transcriptional regulator